LPRAAGPSEYERLRLRIPEGARTRVDSMKAGLLPRTSTGTTSIYDKWLERQPEAVRDSAFKMRAGLIPRAGKAEEPKRESILDAVKRVSEDISKTKKLETGRITPYSDQELFGRILATDPAKQDSLLNFFTSKTQSIFPEGSIGKILLGKRGEVKTDTLDLLNRAIEIGLPEEFDLNELKEGISIANKASAEFTELVKSGVKFKEAEKIIKSKYGMDYEDMEKLHYVDTGKK